MSQKVNDTAPAAVHRVVCHARSRRAAQWLDVAGSREFKPGEKVHSLRPVMNDGIDPHRDIGAILVDHGDAGIVRERWSFLSETYYAVEFGTPAMVVMMRGGEMTRATAR